MSPLLHVKPIRPTIQIRQPNAIARSLCTFHPQPAVDNYRSYRKYRKKYRIYSERGLLARSTRCAVFLGVKQRRFGSQAAQMRKILGAKQRAPGSRAAQHWEASSVDKSDNSRDLSTYPQRRSVDRAIRRLRQNRLAVPPRWYYKRRVLLSLSFVDARRVRTCGALGRMVSTFPASLRRAAGYTNRTR